MDGQGTRWQGTGPATARAASLLAALATALLLLAALSPSARAGVCTDEYTGPSEGSWTTPSNWSKGEPEGGSTVCWAPGTTVVASSGTLEAAAISSGGTLDVAGAQLRLPGGHASALHALAVGSGSLTLDGSLALAAPATVTGGALAGTGTIEGALVNSGGIVEPGEGVGTLTVTGDFTQGAEGALQVELGGEKPGSGFDQLDVGGTADLAGSVHLVDLPAFTPGRSQTFKIVISPNVVGAFASPLGGPSGALYSIEYTGLAAVLTVPERVPVSSAPPLITGTAAVGQTLTCSDGEWAGEVTSFQFAWERDGVTIAGASNGTYTVQAADAGSVLNCVVTAQDKAGLSAPASSPGDAIPLVGAPLSTGIPVITGPGLVGAPLYCSPGTWSPPPSTFAYQWLRNGEAIPGAVSSSYTLTAADAGQDLSCEVTAGLAGSPLASATSAALRVLEPTPLPLSCSARDVELVTLSGQGRSIRLEGVALPAFAGDRVRITVAGLRRGDAAGRALSVTVQSNGDFFATVVEPAGAGAALARYTATVAGHSSPALRLTRRLQIVGESTTVGALRVELRAAGPLGRGIRTVTVVRESGCARSTVVAHVRLSRGSATVALPAPAEPGAVYYYRAQAALPSGLAYSLPVAVAAGI